MKTFLRVMNLLLVGIPSLHTQAKIEAYQRLRGNVTCVSNA